MENNLMKNNMVIINGRIASEFKESHESFGEKFYLFDLDAERLSGTVDRIPILISEKIVDVSRNMVGKKVSIDGQFRTFNRPIDEETNKLEIHVFAREFYVCDENLTRDINSIALDGYVCKKPNYRKTPLGREIADFLLAVNRPYGKSDYIPCICWGRNARYATSLEVGDRIEVIGRIQSREYFKKISETERECRMAYEVSISLLKKAEVEKDE